VASDRNLGCFKGFLNDRLWFWGIVWWILLNQVGMSSLKLLLLYDCLLLADYYSSALSRTCCCYLSSLWILGVLGTPHAFSAISFILVMQVKPIQKAADHYGFSAFACVVCPE
jgi:hypothetical protein